LVNHPDILTYKYYYYISGWWFGTVEFYDFPYIGNFNIPTDEPIFFRGIETTNQIAISTTYWC
jgi:hypothetical protein